MSDWPDEVVERVARAICVSPWEGDWVQEVQKARAAIEAMGGERVGVIRKNGELLAAMPFDAVKALYPEAALLIPLGESDVAE